MDILEILRANSSELISEDLELFRTELAVGGYSEDYQKECLKLIKELENQEKTEHSKKTKYVNNSDLKMNINTVQLNCKEKSQRILSFSEQFKSDLNAMRLSEKYRSSFRTYIKQHTEFNENFVDKNFNIFEEWEMEAIISEISFSEKFLEKYFSILDKDKIARYQMFSEHFYQKHFLEFDTETVLKKGKNEWKKKEKRSNQFAVFLRLKGVQY